MKPIKIIKNNTGTFWNPNDGKETYSRDIIKLLDHLRLDTPSIRYEIKDETSKT